MAKPKYGTGPYHSIKQDGLPKKNGSYMVKIEVKGRPEYDDREICFRNFINGQFQDPYYSDPKTDQLVGWWENE